MATRTQEIIDVVGIVLAEQETSSTALALKDAVATELAHHPLYQQNWRQFEAQPQAQKPILVSILQVVLQDNHALDKKLDDLLAQHQQRQNTPPNTYHAEGGLFMGKVKVGGDFAGRDMTKTVTHHNPDLAALASAFATIYEQVAQKTDLAPQDKADVQAELQAVEKELKNGEVADEGAIRHRLRNVRRMAPDILDVILTTFANPALGLGMVAKKIAEKMRAEADPKAQVA